MTRHIPSALIIARLIAGFVVLALSFFEVATFKTWAIVLLSFGLLSDIFDGIIARRLGVSNEKLRRLDSSVDQVFFISVVVGIYLQCPDFFKSHMIQLGILFGLEILTYLVSFVRFKKEIATHTIGAKIWTLLVFATLIELILKCDSNVWFQLAFWIGIITRLEIIAIILILKKWTNDVPSVFQAIRLRNNKEIKRNKLFNG